LFEEQVEIEPAASYTAARIQRNILQQSSNVGLLATTVLRVNDRNAFAGGADYRIRRFRNQLDLNGHWVITHAPGSATRSTGVGGVANAQYRTKHYLVGAHFDYISPDFRITDLGFLRTRVDRYQVEPWVQLMNPDPWGPVRSVEVGGGYTRTSNTAGLVFQKMAWYYVWARLWNFSTFYINPHHVFETLDDKETRGGPPMLAPARFGLDGMVRTDDRRPWQARAYFDLSRGRGPNRTDHRRNFLSAALSVQPNPRFQASVEVQYDFGVNRQWITNDDVDGDSETDYVFGILDRGVLGVMVRGAVSVTRDLTVQLYMQPFVSTGAFTDVGKLAAPGTYSFIPVSLDFNPDFANRSLRSNVVLRWEYRRGSSLYVVWNITASAEAQAGRFKPGRDLWQTFSAEGTNVFMIKLSYWLSR
jgi:hypothetical protein